MSNVEIDELLNAASLAERLGVKAGTALTWHRNGRIPARRLSHKVLRFNLSEAVAALEARPHDARQGVAR